MTELRKRMIECLQLRGMSERTQQMYVRAVRQLAEHYRKSPDQISEEELRQYFLYIKNVKKYSRAASTIALCGIKFFYQHTLNKDWPTFSLVRPPREKKLPVVLSADEVRKILALVRLPRYRVCLSTIYSCGLRLGGHRDQCNWCGHTRVSYNSCRNRHCPKCQSLAKSEWLDQQRAQLLPVHYFHVVFTIPDQLAQLAFQNKRMVYNILFGAASETLRRIAADPRHLGAQIGFLAVLHTWGQTLLHHPHLHCVVPAGGLSPDRRCWIACPSNFFLPVKVLSRLFRRLFLHYINQAFEQNKLEFNGTIEPLSEPHEFAKGC